MTVMEFLEAATDLSNVHIYIWDCETEKTIFDSAKLTDNEDPVMEIYYSDMANYEVSSYDLYLGDGEINLEINIDYDFDPDEEE